LIPKIDRISISESSFMGFGLRLTHTIASCRERTSRTQNPGDQFLRLSERSVDDGAVRPMEADVAPFAARFVSLTGLHDASSDELLIVLPHVGEELLALHLAPLGTRRGFDHIEDFHRCFSSLICPLDIKIQKKDLLAIY
jgi:hypothetical protein